MDKRSKDFFEIIADFMETTNLEIQKLNAEIKDLQTQVEILKKFDSINDESIAEIMQHIRQIDDRK